MVNRLAPNKQEDELHALRLQEANRFAHRCFLEAQRDLRPRVEAYRQHPATGGGKAMVADIPVEGAEATRLYPGMGGPETFGLLRSAHELGTTVMVVLREEEEARLQAIPKSDRPSQTVALVFGAPGSGKTTLIEALASAPNTALAIEAVGGDTGYLLRQASLYSRMGFRVALVLVWVPLALAARRAAHRTFWNHRGVPPVALARLYRDAVTAPLALLAGLAQMSPDQRPAFLFLDNRGPLAELRLLPALGPEDFMGRDCLLDSALQGIAPDLPALTEIAINATLDQIGAHLDQGLDAHPDLLRTYAAGHQHAHPGDSRSEAYWALWRRSLGVRSLAPGGGEPFAGRVFPETQGRGTPPGPAGLGLIHRASQADQERVYDLFQDLVELAKAGIQQGAILNTVLRKLERSEVSIADVQSALDEALISLDGWKSAKVLAAVKRNLPKV